MAEQWHKWEEDVERLWGRWQVSLVLGLISTAFAVWAAITVPSPGTAIALLGGVAALMSIRPAPMRPLEKAGWILILTVLLTTEIRSIRKTDRENADQRTEQIARLVNLTTSNKEISTKIDKFSPASTPVAASTPSAPTVTGGHHPMQTVPPTSNSPTETPPTNPNRSAEDQHLIDQLNGMVAANKPWGMTPDQLASLSRAMSAFSSPEDRGDFITAAMNDPDSQRFANQLVGVFRAAGWNLPGSGMSMALFSGPVDGVHIVISSKEAKPPGLGPFVQSLRAAGIEPVGEIDPEENPSRFRIIIGSRPH
jgi:hypothetical protein